MKQATRPTDSSPPTSFLFELRDAVTPRTVLLVTAVLGIGLGFIASYLGAFHHPTPHRIPVAIVAPAGAPPGTAQRVASQLNKLPGVPLDARTAASGAAAGHLIVARSVDGALVLSPSAAPDRLLVASGGGGALSSALRQVFSSVEQAQHRQLETFDVRPASAGDARGLSAFYLVVGWMVGGYLVASILGISAGTRPANLRRAIIRLDALLVYAAAAGAGGAALDKAIIASPDGHFAALWGFGTLLVFAVAAFTMALEVVGGVVGIGVAIIIFVVLGNPSAGGAYPGPLLPGFWAAIGPWLPPGAGVSAVRGITYFSDHAITGPVLVVTGYALVGVLVSVTGSSRRPRTSRVPHAKPSQAAGDPARPRASSPS